MLIRTLLNRIERHKSFVYGTARWSDDGKRIEIPVRPRANGRPVCSGCGQPGPCYDHQRRRAFSYVPLWGIAVSFLYAMRRVDCPACGVTVEQVPWGVGKSRLTRSFTIFLAAWAKRLSWTEAGALFGTGWRQVRDAVRYVVDWGLSHRDLSRVEAIGVDEVQFGRGRRYLTLVYEIEHGMRRLLYAAPSRTIRSLLRFFHDQGKDWCGRIQFVCSDMWRAYLKVIAKKLPGAVHILDRYHVVAQLSNALDDVRAAEAKELKRQGYREILTDTRYCFLKNPENLTPAQRLRLKDVLRHDLKSVRAYLLKESFQGFWEYTSAGWARWYLRRWCARAMRSRLEPIKKFVGTLRRHEELMLNWFRAKKAFSCGVIEGLNRRVNLITRMSYGFRSFETMRLALFHVLGKLPWPPVTHRFC